MILLFAHYTEDILLHCKPVSHCAFQKEHNNQETASHAGVGTLFFKFLKFHRLVGSGVPMVFCENIWKYDWPFGQSVWLPPKRRPFAGVRPYASMFDLTRAPSRYNYIYIFIYIIYIVETYLVVVYCIIFKSLFRKPMGMLSALGPVSQGSLRDWTWIRQGPSDPLVA